MKVPAQAANQRLDALVVDDADLREARVLKAQGEEVDTLDAAVAKRTSTSPKSCCENSPGTPSNSTGGANFGRSAATIA